MTYELEALAQRLEEAEKQIANLTALMVAQSDADRTVVAKQIVVKDAKGVRRAEFGMAEGDPRFGLFDANGKKRLTLHIGVLFESDAPQLAMIGTNGRASIVVTALEDGPAVCLFDTKNADGNTGARIQLDDGKPLLLCVKDCKRLWSAP